MTTMRLLRNTTGFWMSIKKSTISYVSSFLYTRAPADAIVTATQDIDAGDIKVLDTLLPPNAGERKTLADMIFAKLDFDSSTNQTTVIRSPEGRRDGVLDPAEGLDPKVVEVYTKFVLLCVTTRRVY